MILKFCIGILRETFNSFLQLKPMIAKDMQFCFAIAIICMFSFTPHSFAQSLVDHFYVKGVADKNGPFANQNIRIIGGEDKITIIRDAPNKMIIVRMTMPISAHCFDTVSTMCISGIVYDAKNTDSPDVGDVIRLNIDPSGKKQTISFLTGEREGTSVSIFSNEKIQQSGHKSIQKLIVIPEKRDPLTLVNRYEEDGMEKAIQVAQEFAVRHPTFSFDGIQQSLDVSLVSIIRSTPPVYVVKLSFDSEHSGYGDRTGQILRNVITYHEMKVMVSDYGIGSAIIDGIWDEFNQKWQK